MNYIEAINNFWSMNELHSFHPTEISLYFYLLKVNNLCSWKESFNHNNYKVMAGINIRDLRTLSSARNKLKQAGLIDFETKNGNSNVLYKLISYAKNAGVSEQVCVGVSEQVCVDVVSSKDKLNKTKQNNKLILLSSPRSDDNPIYFQIAKKYHDLFLTIRGKNKTLQEANADSWIDEVRKLIEIDKHKPSHLIGIKNYLEASHLGIEGTDPFWAETIYSPSSLRKKNKAGEYYFDRISTQANKFFERNQEYGKRTIQECEQLQNNTEN